jgi:F-type H+-transporting ATPase subunit epsilon
MTEINQTLLVEIITPESAFYSKNVHMAVLPGSRGEFGILPGHVTSLVGLQPGLVAIYDNNMLIIDRLFIGNGFVEVTDKSATLLVENCAYLSDYNLAEVIINLAKLKEELDFCKSDSEREMTQKNIQFTETLISILRNFKDNAH